MSEFRQSWKGPSAYEKVWQIPGQKANETIGGYKPRGYSEPGTAAPYPSGRIWLQAESQYGQAEFCNRHREERLGWKFDNGSAVWLLSPSDLSSQWKQRACGSTLTIGREAQTVSLHNLDCPGEDQDGWHFSNPAKPSSLSYSTSWDRVWPNYLSWSPNLQSSCLGLPSNKDSSVHHDLWPIFWFWDVVSGNIT